MKNKILSLFFILMTAWAGLGFAQTAGGWSFSIRHVEQRTGNAKLRFMQDLLGKLAGGRYILLSGYMSVFQLPAPGGTSGFPRPA